MVLIHPNGFTEGAAAVAVLFQQRHRQPVGDHARPALPDLRRRAGAPSRPQDHRRPWRRISRRLFRPHRPRLGRAPRRAGEPAQAAVSYLKKIYFDTVVFTPPQLAALVETFGVDQSMMGTDYPYDMGEYDPIEHLVAAGSSTAGRRCDCRRECEEAVRAVGWATASLRTAGPREARNDDAPIASRVAAVQARLLRRAARASQ